MGQAATVAGRSGRGEMKLRCSYSAHQYTGKKLKLLCIYKIKRMKRRRNQQPDDDDDENNSYVY